MLPVYAPPRTQYSSRSGLEGYETVQVPKARQYPLFTPPQPSEQVRINVHPNEMC
jgi:hypothetical protein